MKKISISLLLFASMIHSMELPPQKPAQESVGWQNAPRDVKRIIQTMVLNGITTDNLQETIKNLNNFALVNKDFHDFLNSPENIIALITSVAQKTPTKNEYDIAQGLKNMPGMQHPKVKEWVLIKKYPSKTYAHLLGEEVPENIVNKSKFNSNEPFKKGDLFAIKVWRGPDLRNYTYVYGCFVGGYRKRRSQTGELIDNPNEPWFIGKGNAGHCPHSKEDFGKIPQEMIP